MLYSVWVKKTPNSLETAASLMVLVFLYEYNSRE